jgi:hypothetical protein
LCGYNFAFQHASISDIEVSKDDTIQDLNTGGQRYSKREPQVLAEDKLRFEVFVLLTEG